ncbi:RNA-binding protein 25 isoform X2 [Punica granatum]|uniref:RNA-binding protein 25 isoform X2 n=1 Tax=Punica granatum TaxID=22663 RepID=A0A6P8D3W4_PUNGR|nr:RNA-binding protein 25 isoform X2 [Punica granatum]
MATQLCLRLWIFNDYGENRWKASYCLETPRLLQLLFCGVPPGSQLASFSWIYELPPPDLLSICVLIGLVTRGLPGYSAPYTTVARPAFPPRPHGNLGVLTAVPRPPISLIPGVRPIIPPVVRPGLVPVTPAEKPQTTIYIGKIAPTADNDFMLSLLKLCGPVKSWKRAQDPTDGTLKRFGFCEFESAEGVLRALRLLNKLNIDGQELVLNLNEATKGYLLRYIEKKTENAKKDTETEAASTAEIVGGAVPGAENNESAKRSVDLKKDDSAAGKRDDSDSGKKDESDSGKKELDYTEFGLVTDEDREADREALEKLTGMIEERLKSLPPPPPHAPADVLGITDSEAAAKSKDRDSDADLVKNDAEDKDDDETTSDNKASSEHDKTETSSPDRSRRYDRRSRDRDRDRDLKREKEREIERYEREAERERIRKEREQRRKIEDAEREYEKRLKDWEYREREIEKQRQYEREKEKERQRKRKKEIMYDEEDGEDDSRRWSRSAVEERRKKRQREKEDDLADRRKEEEEIAEAKKRAEEEEKQRLLQIEETEQVSDRVVNGNENSAMVEEPVAERKDAEDDYGGGNHIGEEASRIGIGDGLLSTVDAASDVQNNNNAPAKKLGFGLSGSGKRTAVPSVFQEDDDDDAQKEKKMRPLVPIDYSNEEMEAVQLAAGMPQPNLAAAAEFAKRISNNSTKEEKPESERERSRRSHDRPSQREKDRYNDENKEKGLHREHGSEKSKTTPDNKKLLDAKQLIDMIPKTKEDLFSYEINWALYDQHELHERMRPWISKKITEFLGEEEKSLVDYIVSSTQEHVKASDMLETLKSILDEEAEMFVLKMWRMLIFEIKKVETGLHMRSRT